MYVHIQGFYQCFRMLQVEKPPVQRQQLCSFYYWEVNIQLDRTLYFFCSNCLSDSLREILTTRIRTNFSLTDSHHFWICSPVHKNRKYNRIRLLHFPVYQPLFLIVLFVSFVCFAFCFLTRPLKTAYRETTYSNCSLWREGRVLEMKLGELSSIFCLLFYIENLN